MVVDWDATHFQVEPCLVNTSVQRSLLSNFWPLPSIPAPVQTPVTMAVSGLSILTFISLSSERVNLCFFVSSRTAARVINLPSVLIADQLSARMSPIVALSFFKSAAAHFRSKSISASSAPPALGALLTDLSPVFFSAFLSAWPIDQIENISNAVNAHRTLFIALLLRVRFRRPHFYASVQRMSNALHSHNSGTDVETSA